MPDAFDPYNEWLGIPPEEQPPNHYRLLGINLFEGDGEKIASAALARMETLRNYQLSSHVEASQKILNQVAQARICLLDAEKKAAYDSELKQSLSPAEPPGPTATDPAKIPHPQRPAEEEEEQSRNLDAQHPEEHIRDVASVNSKEGGLNDKDLDIENRQIYQWLMQDEKSQPVVTENSHRAVNLNSQPVVADDQPKIKYYKYGPKEKETHLKDGKKDGRETHWYRNGQKWIESHYKDGKRDGRETFWYENGQKWIESHYKDGKRDGLETHWYENGQQRKEGQYKNGKKDGPWTLWLQNGQKRAKGLYKNDKQDGPWTVWDENGNKVRKIQYKHGEEVSRSAVKIRLAVGAGVLVVFIIALFVMTYETPDGKLETNWYPNGQKRSEGHYKDGKEDGLWTNWYPNGQKRSEGHYNDGKEDGLWTAWYSNGKKSSERRYTDGKPHGLWTQQDKNGRPDGLWTQWDKNGQKILEYHFKDGKQDGLWTYWNENGQKATEGHYKNGKQDGPWTQWDNNGNKTLEIQYKDDEEVSRKEF